MLHDPERHETLLPIAWDEGRARGYIGQLVADCDRVFAEAGAWPWHPDDLEPADDASLPPTPLYFGATGVIWALHRLQDIGAVQGSARYDGHLEALAERHRDWLATLEQDESASYLMGETPLLMLAQQAAATPARAERLAELIERNLAHPARELMWGSPGTLLAALWLHHRFGGDRWAGLFRRTAARLREQLRWSDTHGCHYWTQHLYGEERTFLDAVHGFVATASVLIRGRGLLAGEAWAEWSHIIERTIATTATREDGLATWRAQLIRPPRAPGQPVKRLVQFCHGSPGFVVCLADFPASTLDDLLLGAGEATWVAGPLRKGANLCHGTGGNGYAFLKLWQRTGDARWLQRARAFAMHGIEQSEAARRRHGQWRYSLWTGDPGFAVFLWDCIVEGGGFPTLDVFYP